MTDHPSFCNYRVVRANKTHTCVECRHAIAPGEHYERAAGVWAGDFLVFKTCERCRNARSVIAQCLRETNDQDIIEHGNLRELWAEMEDALGPYPKRAEVTCDAG